MKKLKYKIRASITRFLLRCCRLLKGHCYCKNEFYYETIYIKIKDLKNSWEENKFSGIPMDKLISDKIWPPNKVKSWSELINSIKTYGVKVNPEVIRNNSEYQIYDGNHRIKVLEYLYGGDHQVKVDVYLKHKKYIPYYNTMGIMDDIEYKKILFRQRIKETTNKIYEPK